MKYIFFAITCFFIIEGQLACKSVREPLTILVVLNLFPRRSETFILNQITGLIDRGHSVLIHAYMHGKPSDTCAIIEKYKLKNRVSYGDYCSHDLTSCDILYCQFGMMGNKMLRQKRQTKSKAKLVTCFRGIDITTQLKKYPNTYAQLLKEGDLFLPVCDVFARKLLDLGADPAKVIVHHSAINCQDFLYHPVRYKNGECINLISVSRLVEKKGIEDALHAVALIVKKYPNVHYTIVGDGPLYTKLKNLIGKLGISKYVTMVGSVPHQKIQSFLKKAHLFILPSTKGKDGNQEGIPNALKEAMALGLPVISTYHSGIPELVDHMRSGLLVPERNPQRLAESIIYLIEHSDTWESMGKIGRQKIEEEFDIEDHLSRLEGYFYSLVADNN